MTRIGSKPSGKRIPDASQLEQRYGEHAAEYAEVREETARELGESDRADAWDQVERQLSSDDEH